MPSGLKQQLSKKMTRADWINVIGSDSSLLSVNVEPDYFVCLRLMSCRLKLQTHQYWKFGILLFCCCCRCWGHSASNDGGNSAASDIWSVCRIQKTNWKQEARLLQAEGRQKKASSACVCKSTESLCKVLIDQYALHLPVQFTCSPFVRGTVLCIAHNAFDWLCHMICSW